MGLHESNWEGEVKVIEGIRAEVSLNNYERERNEDSHEQKRGVMAKEAKKYDLNMKLMMKLSPSSIEEISEILYKLSFHSVKQMWS